MKNKLLAAILLAMPFPFQLAAQGWVNDGAEVQISSGTEVRINAGEMINQNDGNIVNQGNIYVDNDWTQTGSSTAYSGSGWIWFNGNANQNLSSVSALTISNLGVDNANSLVLGSDITIGNSLDLNNNGNVELGTNNLIISSGAAISNYDDSHYIISNSTGYLQQEVGSSNVVFPVGNSSYNPATLNNAGTSDDFQVRIADVVYDSGYTGTAISALVVNRTWYIDEVVSGGSDVSMTLQWDSADELLGFDRSDCGIAHWDGSAWDNGGSYGSATNVSGTYYTQSRSSISSFSPFAVEDAANVANYKASNPTIDYAANEGERTATATSVAKENQVETSVPSSINLFPNPTSGLLNVRFEGHDAEQARIRIYAANGQLIFDQQYAINSNSIVQINELHDLPTGTYFLQAIMDNGTVQQIPFVKTRD